MAHTGTGGAGEPVLSESYFALVRARDGERHASIETLMKSFEDTGDSVIVRAERRDGSPLTVRARYLIGCDGGSSRVRKQMGVDLLGDTEIARTRSTLIRSPDVMRLFPDKPAWMSWILNPRITGSWSRSTATSSGWCIAISPTR